MGDSLTTVIAIALAAILMFVFPLMAVSERSDDISQLTVQTATNEFVDDVRTTGRMTYEDYEAFLDTISSTGNTFDVEIELQLLDDNPSVKVATAETTKIGENVYYNLYIFLFQYFLCYVYITFVLQFFVSFLKALSFLF